MEARFSDDTLAHWLPAFTAMLLASLISVALAFAIVARISPVDLSVTWAVPFWLFFQPREYIFPSQMVGFISVCATDCAVFTFIGSPSYKTFKWRNLHATHRCKDTEADGTRLLNKCDISEVVLNVAAIFLRCHTKLLPEDIVHVCLAGETTLKGDVNQRDLGLPQQLLRSAEPHLQYVLVRC